MHSKMSTLLLFGLLMVGFICSWAAFDEKNQRPVRILDDSDSKNIIFQTTLIGSELADIIWCGDNKESVLVVTEGGIVYYSNNGGLEWKKLQNIFQKAGQQMSDEEDVGIVESLMQSPVDKNLVFFLGSEGVHWYSEDCGKTIKALDTGKNIHTFQFHPLRREWILASAFTSCDQESDKPCKTSQELYMTQDLGNTWTFLVDYVIQFSWAAQDYSFLENIPMERIVITQDLRTKTSQKLGAWSEDVQMVYSDDFFKNKKTVFEKGQKFLITTNFFFVVKVEDEDKQDVSLFISDPKAKSYKFQSITLPSRNKFYERSYIILDTSEGQVFLHVNHENVKSKFGTIYISDSTGIRYSLSLRNNVRTDDDLSDFESVQGLEGIYFANIYDYKIVAKAKNELTADEEVPTEKGSKKSKGKETQGKPPTSRIQDLDEYKQTRISFDKGGMWSPLTPPKLNALGEKIECEEKDCSLHLHSLSSRRFGPFYTTNNSLGLIMGTGNVGKYLSNKEDEVNTYLSRDGGLTWYEIKRGSHTYEIGDQGSIILVASDQQATKYIFYTWNEGISWSMLEISDTPIEVRNIITEPSNTAQKFIVYGRTTTNSEESRGDVKKRKGVLIGVDFSSLQKRICELPDRPNDDASDYETWSPNEHVTDSCLMGHKITYVRRKRQAECFNPQEFERIYDYKNCQCTEEDWECDLGYERKGNGPCLLPVGKEPSYEPPEECDGYYSISSGYRKVAGSTCEGGINHESIKFPCPSKIFSKKSATILLGFTFLGLAFIGLIAWAIVAKSGQLKDNFKIKDLSKSINLIERKGLETTSKNIPEINKPQHQQQILSNDGDEDDIGNFDPRT